MQRDQCRIEEGVGLLGSSVGGCIHYVGISNSGPRAESPWRDFLEFANRIPLVNHLILENPTSNMDPRTLSMHDGEATAFLVGLDPQLRPVIM